MNRPTILCVDDERNILLTLRMQLLRHFPDYRIEIAESGEEALDLVEDLLKTGDKIPLVIADQIMPGIKGDELLIELHNRHPEILKVMLTGQARAEDIGNVINQGSLYRFIAKPWNETDLILTVTEALRRYQQDQQLAQQQAVLEQANRELEALNASLEQQVRERTQQLQYQEGKLKETQRLAQLGGWELNLKSGKEYWSEEIYTIHELPLECDRPSCLEHPEYYINFYAPEARPLVQAAFHKAITCGEAYELEVPFITAQGNHRWVKTHGQPILENGVVVRITGVLGDITDRKQAEILLRKSETSLKVAQRIARVGNWEFDLATQAVSWSDELFPIYGRDATQWQPTYLEFKQQVYPEDWPPFERVIEQAITEGIPYEIEHRVIHPDGSMSYALSKGEAVFNEQGQVIKLIGTTQDISEAKQAQEALHQSEEKFRQLAETIQEIFFIHDAASYELLYISPAFEQIMGIPEAAIYENPMLWQELAHPDDRDRIQAAFQQQCASEDFDQEYRVVRPDGDVRWLRTRTFSVYDRSGKIYRIAGISEDVTDRKQAEVALQKLNQELEQRVEERTQELVQSQQILQESEQRFCQLADNIDAVFWMTDVDKQKIIYINRQYEELWRQSRESLYKNPLLFLEPVHPEDRDRLIAAFPKQIQGNYDEEYRIVHPDGEIRWIRDRAFPIRNDAGQVYRVAGIAEDISERKQQEAERKQSELLLRRQVAAVEAALDGIAILNGDNYIYLNKAHADIFGYGSPEELLSKTWRELYRPQELCFFEQEVFPVLMQQKYWRGEVIAKHKDGTTFDEEVSLIITEDGDLICVCRDVSERQAALREREEAQRDLQESRNMLKLVLDTIPQRVFWKDNQSRFLGCNPAFANDYQLTYEDIVGKTDLELPWAEWGELYRSDDVRVMNSGIPKLNYEEPTNNLNGERIWIRSNKIPLTNSQGNIIGILGCYEDITERKLAEEALQAEQLRLKLALDAAQMATWSCNLQMSRLIWSDRAQQIFGFEPGTFPGDWATFTAMIYPEDYDRVIQAIAHTFETGDRYEIEYRIRRLDDKIRWVSVWGVIPKYTSPDERQIVGVVVDISDRKQAETAIRQANVELETRVEERTAQLKQAAQAAEAANRAKSDFLANVSHELRTPLNGILGYAQILRSSPRLNPTEQQGIEVIHRCGSHLLTLINDILDLAKIEARRLELIPCEFHFPAFLQNLADICRLRATKKGIRFLYQADPNLSSSIYADEKRLRQILLNLLGNALKFTAQGSVTFKIELKQQHSELKTQTVCFQIEDTGIGIAPEQVERILLPFEQAGDPMHKAQGTGLGLAITRNLLKLMGSTLQITSQLGQGSSFGFEIELQIADPAVQQVVVPPAQIKGFKGQPRQILIIDDQADNRLVFRNLLEPLGFIILEANNGKTGLEQAIEYQPDLLIVDLVMPEMDGIQMLHHLRELPQGKIFKVIVSSARAFAEDRQQSLAAGADDFLAKPVQATVLLNLVQKHLNLEWCYETLEPEATLALETQDSREPTAMAIPEKAVLAQLLDLALRGNIQKLLTQIEALEHSDPGMKPFTTQLRTWTESFQLKKIRNFLHSLNSQKNSQN